MLPEFIRYFIRDAIEGVLAVIGGVQVLAFFDPTVQDPALVAHSILIGAVGALIAAGRRNYGRFKVWLNQKLGTSPDA